MSDDKGHWIETYTGRKFHQTHPDVAQVDLDDIAHSLSMICRYNGHVSKHYSVGHHVIFVYEMLRRLKASEPRLALLGLMHDFEEAYTGDIIGPMKTTMKAQIPGFRDWWENLLSKLNAVIYDALDVPLPTEEEQKIIKFFDMRALGIESKHVLPFSARTYDDRVKEYLRVTAHHVVESPSAQELLANINTHEDNMTLLDIWALPSEMVAERIKISLAAVLEEVQELG